jgi:hypothetical protein
MSERRLIEQAFPPEKKSRKTPSTKRTCGTGTSAHCTSNWELLVDLYFVWVYTDGVENMHLRKY